MNSSRCLLVFSFFILGCASDQKPDNASALIIREDREKGTISILRSGNDELLVVQNARPGIRPYIHPIMAPDGRGELTEYSPSHHKHQTGLYWGLKQVNGRDFFMNWKEDHWRRIAIEVLNDEGENVRWRTTYRMLDENGREILEETQTWSFHEADGKYVLDLQWKGSAMVDLTMGKFYVGGLFVRMPWREGIRGEVINASGQRNGGAEGQRAVWNDIGIEVPGRDDMAHIVIFDHPDNRGFPIPWRVDNELGVGPSRQILGDWRLAKGETEVVRYRLFVYTGDIARAEITAVWKDFVCD